MSFQTDLVAALDSALSQRLYPQYLPEELSLGDGPAVVYRILNKQRIQNFCSKSSDANNVMTQYSISFDCWANDYSIALDTAELVSNTIDADTTLVSFPEAAPGEDFEPVLGTFVEPVYFGFFYQP